MPTENECWAEVEQYMIASFGDNHQNVRKAVYEYLQSRPGEFEAALLEPDEEGIRAINRLPYAKKLIDRALKRQNF